MSADVTRPAVDRTQLPAPGPSRPFVFPTIEKSVGANGLGVWTVRHPSVPLVVLTLLVRRGSADDPAGKEGLAALALDMLDEGSAGRSAIEFHEALARIGAQVDSDIGSDATFVTVTALSRFLAPALALAGDMVGRPTLAESDVARVRALRMNRLLQMRDVPSAVADRAFLRLLYGGHPYGHSALGVERSLPGLTTDDVRAFHQAAVRPSEATLIAVGDCDHDTVRRLADEAFSGWAGSSTLPRVAAAARQTPPRLNIVDRPGAPQSELRIGHVAVARQTPDYHALVAANMVLGGQFVSRINLNLREDKGFTYGARTSFDFRRLPGPFSLQVSVQTAATARAISESLGEIAAIRGSRPVSADELSLAVAALTRGYARNFETTEQISRAVSQIALHGLPDDYFARFVPELERVTPEDVTRAAAAHLHPDRLTTVIVGDASVVAPDLPSLDLGAVDVMAAETL